MTFQPGHGVRGARRTFGAAWPLGLSDRVLQALVALATPLLFIWAVGRSEGGGGGPGGGAGGPPLLRGANEIL